MSKNPWADQIGPVYSVESLARDARLSQEEIGQLVVDNAILSFKSSEGTRLFPAPQVSVDKGRLVGGLGRLLQPFTYRNTLVPDYVPRVEEIDDLADCPYIYNVVSWFNRSNDSLRGNSPWDELQDVGLSNRLMSVAELAARRYLDEKPAVFT